MKMIAEYLEKAIDFERLAAAEKESSLKVTLLDQAAAYGKLAEERARQLSRFPRSHNRTETRRNARADRKRYPKPDRRRALELLADCGHRRSEQNVATSCLILMIAWACVSFAQAADQPTSGFLYNTSERSSLTYQCSASTRSAAIECEFMQTSVRRKADPKDLQKELQTARTQFGNGVKLGADECSGVEKFLNALRTGDTSGLPDPLFTSRKLNAMSAGEKKALDELMSATVAYCRAPTEANFLNIARIDFLKKTKTCIAASNAFKQTFRRVETSDNWTSNEGPTGPCGVVNVSRFEAERGSTNLTFYRYITRKIITEPKGQAFIMQCSDLDQAEYTYDWRSKEHYLPCEFIEFSPL
jgi:hypothetical protein